MKTYNLYKLVILVGIFSIAMGFLESAVVVYLREIYYPFGFSFPLTPIDHNITFTEVLRETATIIMLIIIGYITGTSFSTRFAWFIYSFAIWDIFYYIFLKFLLDWPNSLMTNDILFLIPIVWIGPVITPIIVSLTMILLAFLILKYDHSNITTKINSVEWSIFIVGSIVLIISFSWDYAIFLLEHKNFSQTWSISDKTPLFGTTEIYIPRQLNWLLFIIGETIILLGIALILSRLKKSRQNLSKIEI